jgi:hypothetical protein
MGHAALVTSEAPMTLTARRGPHLLGGVLRVARWSQRAVKINASSPPKASTVRSTTASHEAAAHVAGQCDGIAARLGGRRRRFGRGEQRGNASACVGRPIAARGRDHSKPR